MTKKPERGDAWRSLQDAADEPMRVDLDTARATCKQLVYELVDLVEQRDELRVQLESVEADIKKLLRSLDS